MEAGRPADAEINARRGDHLLGDGHDLALGERRGVRRQPGTQPLALCDIEDGEALEERPRLGVATLARSPLLLGLGVQPVGLDEGTAILPLADTPACRLSLCVCKPP